MPHQALTKKQVLEALAAQDRLGQDEFNRLYGQASGSHQVSMLPSGLTVAYPLMTVAAAAHELAFGAPIGEAEPKKVAALFRNFGFGVDGSGGPIERDTVHPDGRPVSRFDGPRPLVWIAPSYGNSASRRRFRDTLASPVPFAADRLNDLLTPAERAELGKLHPLGAARFWGATGFHTDNIRRLQPGDPVIFTGQNHVQAVGRIGFLFQNQDFADALWPPAAGETSWLNVYSVLEPLQAPDISYEDLWQYTGSNVGDQFQSARLLRGEKARAVIDGLELEAPPELLVDNPPLPGPATKGGDLVPAEANRTQSTEYMRQAGVVQVERLESALVQEYIEYLKIGKPKRLRLDVGIADLYVEESRDLVEAKSSATHHFVRQALAQLLTYAASSPRPIDRLTGLFPESPLERDVNLLHKYGIDCVFREGPATFRRLEAQPQLRQAILALTATTLPASATPS